MTVEKGELRAVIGPNGAGKTTLVAQLSGALRPDAGAIRFAGSDVTTLPAFARARLGLQRTFQITSIFHEFTALYNVALAVQAHDGHSFRFFADARREARLRTPARAAPSSSSPRKPPENVIAPTRGPAGGGRCSR